MWWWAPSFIMESLVLAYHYNECMCLIFVSSRLSTHTWDFRCDSSGASYDDCCRRKCAIRSQNTAQIPQKKDESQNMFQANVSAFSKVPPLCWSIMCFVIYPTKGAPNTAADVFSIKIHAATICARSDGFLARWAQSGRFVAAGVQPPHIWKRLLHNKLKR